MSDTVIKVEHVSKEYRLGMIGGTTLRADLQRLWAKMRGQEDPTTKIGADNSHRGERFLALDDVSFEVKRGEALGIIGHNGAGKSTLLKLLARVTAPTKGSISFNGRIASMLEVGTGFHGELSGRENIYINGAILGMTKREIDRKLDEIVAFAEMEQFIDTPVKRYSSGMYVKLAFSVAAHLDAEIMIMDEVLAVGDMKFQQKCLGRMNDAATKEGRTVLFVSHNMGSVKSLCNSGLLLSHGTVAYEGSASEAIAKYITLSGESKKYIDVDNDSNKTIQITKAWMSDSSGTRKENFSIEDKLGVIIEITANKSVSNEVLSLILLDKLKNPVFRNDIPLRDFLGNSLCRKAYIEYPAGRLTAGTYSWNMYIHMPKVQCYEKYGDVCSFRIHDYSSQYTGYNSGICGIVFMNYTIDGKAFSR